LRRSHTILILCVLVIAVTIITHVGMLVGPFSEIDDLDTIAEHPAVLQNSVASFLSHSTSPHMGLYVPVTQSLWHVLSWTARLDKPDAIGLFFSPLPFRIASLTVFALSGVALLVLASRLGLSMLGMTVAALVFVVHPVQVESVAWMGQDDRQCWDPLGERIDIHTFWSLHWSLFEHFNGLTEADPFARLVRFAEDVTGLTAPEPLTLDRSLLRQGAFENSIIAGLEARAGGSPAGLPSLWEDHPPQRFTLDPMPAPDEHALLTRYLMHRFLCPTFYLWFADPRYLLTTMFAMLARYRIERERGFDALGAVRQLDRFFVHSATGASLFATESTFEPWRAMACLARSVIVE